MENITLSLLSYAVIEKEFYIEDFTISFNYPYKKVLKSLRNLEEKGFLKESEKIHLTYAGLIASLGQLHARKGRWWLVVETPNNLDKPFIEISYNTFVAPFTWLLYEKYENSLSQAFVVRGNIGNVWIERYCKIKPVYRLKLAEENISKIEDMIDGGCINIDYLNTIVRKVVEYLNRAFIDLGMKTVCHYVYSSRTCKLLNEVEKLKKTKDYVEENIRERLQ